MSTRRCSRSMSKVVSPTLEARRAQTFPVLTAEEIARMHRFGMPRRFANGERVLETGRVSPGIYVVLSGAIRVTGRDGHGHDFAVVEHGPGNFSGELSQLSGRPSFVDGIAVGDTETLEISTEQAACAAHRRGRARREDHARADPAARRLIEIGHRRPGADRRGRIAGRRAAAELPQPQRHPASAARSGDRHRRAARSSSATRPSREQLPLVVCPDGEVLRNPTESELARCIGMLDAEPTDTLYDVAIVGAGPAGLATAVYAASEGLSVLVIDARAFGGQAGASARIENYLGFPTGISGQALAGRGVHAGAEVRRAHADSDGARCARLRACGARRAVAAAPRRRPRRSRAHRRDRHRRALPAPASAATSRRWKGRGVWYWASPIEAQHVRGRGGRAGRRRQLRGAGGGVPRPGTRRRSGCWCAARASRRACRAT